jgi:hypothetical protein
MCTGGSSESTGPLAHLIGGLVGEGYCANIVWLDAGIYECSDSMCNDTGFAAARARNNKQRALCVENSTSL